MAKHKFRFNLNGVDWCKTITCLATVVAVILAIMIYLKVKKNCECKQGYKPRIERFTKEERARLNRN